MRQIGDMLVWLAVLAAVAGLIYAAPRLAETASALDERGWSVDLHGPKCLTCRQVAVQLTPGISPAMAEWSE
jgi:hypothetical protein